MNEHLGRAAARCGLSLSLIVAQSVSLAAMASDVSETKVERGAFTPLKRSGQAPVSDEGRASGAQAEKFTPLKRGDSQESIDSFSKAQVKDAAEAELPSGSQIRSEAAAENAASTGAGNVSSAGAASSTDSADSPETSSAGAASSTDSKAEEEALAEHARREKAAEMAAQALHNEALDHYELARAYLGQWNFEMAERELKASLMCEPGIKAVHRDYVLVSLMMFNPFKALAEFMMVVGLGEPVPYSEKQKTAIRDDNAKAHYEKGIALARDSKWTDAITEYQWAQTYHPNDARISRSLAFAYGSAGEFEQAEKEYATSFAQDPGDAFTHADLAFLLEKSGDKQKALAQMQEAVALQPKVAALHVDLGWLAEAKGDLDLASGEFRRAVDLAPRHASLWTHLGKLLARKGDNEGAREAYQKALSLDPQQADAAQGLESLSPATPLADNTKKAG